MRMRARTSTGRWRIGAWRRISKSWLIALVVVANVSSGCALLPKRTIVEPPPACPELSEAQLEALMTKSDPQVIDWYWNEYDPFCEALYNASRSADAD